MARCKDCIHCDVCENVILKLSALEYGKCKHFITKTDVAEVVRCKDCKHRNPYGSKCLRDNLWHDDDDFCSYGERKE